MQIALTNLGLSSPQVEQDTGPAEFLLMETGDFLLLESGDKIILE